MTVNQSDTDVPKIVKPGMFPAPVGVPHALLRVEGAAIAIACGFAFHMVHASWLMFAILFLAPDLSMAFYLAGPRIGSAGYNAVHSYIGPILLAVASWLSDWRLGEALCLIWIAHIGFDRALGYGLKYASAFSDTHLGQMTRVVRAPH